MEDSIQLHVTFAFENKINLRELFMIVRPRVHLDIDEVNRRDGIIRRRKRAARQAARASDWGDLVEMSDDVILVHDQNDKYRASKKLFDYPGCRKLTSLFR